jgi:hypothetical protein
MRRRGDEESGPTDSHHELAWRFALAEEYQVLHPTSRVEESGARDRELRSERETPSQFMVTVCGARLLIPSSPHSSLLRLVVLLPSLLQLLGGSFQL